MHFGLLSSANSFQNVLTSRFMIGFMVCVLSTAVAVFVQVDDHEKRLV